MAFYLPEKHLIYHPMMRTGSSATAMFLKGIGAEIHGRHHEVIKRQDPRDVFFSTVRNHFDFLVTGYHKIRTELSFKEWLHHFASRKTVKLPYQIPTGHNNPSIMVNGVNLYRNKTILTCTKILRYETLEHDLSELLDMEVELPQANVTSVKKDYRTYYDQEDIDLVLKSYEREMKLYGYDFENGVKRC